MNKTAIKNYAIWARVNLIEAVKQRAYQYEITKDSITAVNADVVSGKPLSKDEKEQRRQLIDQINLKGFDQVMEEVAYTWFNRFIALRFMEVNGYLPTKVRVFSDGEGNFKPELLKEALTVDLPVDKAKVMELLEKQDNEELYKMLLIAQCNELSFSLPDMFEVISNYTELLFPNTLLKEDSVLGQMVNLIPEEDWTDAVQIIGWLYQYYNSELKDETFALLKKNVKISKERIPAATQLFTPDWIVRYMVENSLGRLWYEGHPKEEIKKNWKYYLDEAEQEPEVEEELKKIREEYKTIRPEDIKVIDPCMGSGHILVYAFDVLMQIYTSAGWSERDAAEAILENNLYGLDIDDRAGQLAYFAVMMKARKYSRRILTKNIRPKVFSIQESNSVKINAWWRLGPEEEIARKLIRDLTDAKEYGSILNLSVTTEELKALRNRLDDIDRMSDMGNLLDMAQSDEITRQMYPLVELAEVMVQKYDVVVTNPPYMGSGGMSGKLSDYVKADYPNSKSDLSTVFMEKTLNMLREQGRVAMINIPVWMFLSSYEELRKDIINNNSIQSMVHPGRGIFGSDFGSVTFVIYKMKIEGYNSIYHRLFDEQGEVKSVDDRERAFLSRKGWHCINQERFLMIPGYPIAYWASENLLNDYKKGIRLDEVAQPKQGIKTADKDRFLRFWQEIDYTKTSIIAADSGKWFPCNKGGVFRKWYGNNEYVVNWENNGYEICNFRDDSGKLKSRPQNLQYMLKEGITYTNISISSFGARYSPSGYIYDAAGSGIFCNDNSDIYYVLGFLTSSVAAAITQISSPTMSFEVGQISALPFIFSPQKEVDELVHNSINESKNDWDAYETSWDFKSNPLI